MSQNLQEVNESPIYQSSGEDGDWDIDFAGYVPSDATTLTAAILTLKTYGDVLVEGKLGEAAIDGLVATFSMSDLDKGKYILYFKVTTDTGQTREAFCEVVCNF